MFPKEPHVESINSLLSVCALITGKQRTPVAGEVPNPLDPPTGCAFHPRCPHAFERCKVERPSLIEHEDGG